MKKVILIIVVTFIINILLFSIYFFVNFNKNYVKTEIPFDRNLELYNYKIQNDLLKKLGYDIQINYLNYDKEKYDIIFHNGFIEDLSLKDWNKWLKKGRRLIIYFNESYFVNLENNKIKATSLKDGSVDSKDFSSDAYEEASSYNYDEFMPDNFKVNQNNKYTINLNRILVDLKDSKTQYEKYFNRKLIEIIPEEIYKENKNGGEVIYIFDEYLFCDKNLLKQDNAILLRNLLKDYYGKKIVIDETKPQPVNDFKFSLPFFLKGNILFISLQIVLIIVLLFFIFMKRFGNIIDKEKYDRKSIANHLIAVGNFYEKTKNMKVLVQKLDKYFILTLFKISKIKDLKNIELNKLEVISKIRGKYNISEKEEELFEFNNIDNIEKITIERELFIKKIKRGKK